ncbi:DUF4190 domain-containing protein [Demequina flava]|uniref:DUF4190 domain-containing protein n=1 Tax=Demequina flava TaxID=1095025 RepID=UPI000783E3FC|nr:DUF4190 domain-containing protein [Demequina flava]
MTDNDPFLRPPPKPGDPAAPSQASAPQSFTPQETPEWAPQATAPGQADTGLTYGDPSAAQQPAYAAPGAPGAPAPTQDAYAQSGGMAPSQPQPAYGAPAYGSVPPPSYGAPASTSNQTDGFSIAALVTGIVGLSVVAIALGAVGLRRTAQGARKGTWMAVTGLVLGTVSTIAWAVYITSILVATVTFLDETGIDWETELSTSQNYGDDPELDVLYDQCGAGDGQACDDLYWASAIGSEYEEYAETCGGRGVPTITGYCADE